MRSRATASMTAIAAATMAAAAAQATPVFVNEIHYDNVGEDRGEAVEIAGPTGTSLRGWSLWLYNGSNGRVYASRDLAGTLPDDAGGFGVLSFETTGLQNGEPDGVALVNDAGTVVQLLSYEGRLQAVDGPAAGLWSEDLGVAETAQSPAGSSLQLAGLGTEYESLRWTSSTPESFGRPNPGQGFAGEPERAPIFAIQGRGHQSPYRGHLLETRGIVTSVRDTGYTLQDRVGDGAPETSDALYVYSPPAADVQVGELRRVLGIVEEYVPGGEATGNLSITEIVALDSSVEAASVPLPAPVVLGASGRPPPTHWIDDDGLERFEPARDGIDFWESLEAMRVRVNEARVVSAASRFGEVHVVADDGRGATGGNARGGLTGTAEDDQPEQLQIQVPTGTSAPALDTGARFDSVTGVLGYSFGSYELYPSHSLRSTASPLTRETSPLVADRNSLTIASFNVQNLDPGDGNRFDALAAQIVHHLRSPAIVALQEVQDDDGAVDSGATTAAATWRKLILAVERAGGPTYRSADIAPEDGADGGEPGGNIRNGYLYDPTRIGLDLARLRRLEGSGASNPFRSSRKPLVASFTFRGTTIEVINVHATSRLGSDPLYGARQPPRIAGAEHREAQSAAIAAEVRALLDANADAAIIVLGDLNAMQHEASLTQLATSREGPLVDLGQRLPAQERYTYVRRGVARQLDYILVSPALARSAAFDVVHVNAEFSAGPSDHDPVLARLVPLPVPEPSAGWLRVSAVGTLAAVAWRRTRSATLRKPS